MASVSRTAQFAKVLKVLKKHYKPVAPDPHRPALAHLLFACCLEDAHHEAAEEAFATVVHTFFDWNEVRVTSISELSEVVAILPDPRSAANRLKRILHDVFEEKYSFDLEDLRKKNLGPTIKWLEKIDGATRFSIAYVVQAALGGHAIPIDSGTMRVLRLLELVCDKDVAVGTVPGLERAVAKSKGIEFGSLLHELGADFMANPYAPKVREILRQMDPGVTDRLPQRRIERPAKKPPAAEPAHPAKASQPAQQAPQTPAEPKEPPAAQRTAEKGVPEVASPEQPAAAAAKKKPAAGKKKPAGLQEGDGLPSESEPVKGRSASAAIAKRKPR
jgi:endonuclease-3